MSIEYALLDLNAIYGDEAQRQADIEAMELEGTENALAELEDEDLRSTVGLHECHRGHCLPVDDRVPSADPECYVNAPDSVQPRGGDAVPAEDTGCGCGTPGCTAKYAEAESMPLELGGES